MIGEREVFWLVSGCIWFGLFCCGACRRGSSRSNLEIFGNALGISESDLVISRSNLEMERGIVV